MADDPRKPTIPCPMKESQRSLPVRSSLERRQIVLGAAAALLMLIFAVSELTPHAAASIGLLYAVPVVLGALELGLRGGLAAAAVSVCLLAVTTLTAPTGISAAELSTEAAGLFALAAIAGRFSDRMRGARARQEQLLQTGLTLAGPTERLALPELAARRAVELVAGRGARATIADAGTAQLGTLEGDVLSFTLGARGARGLLEVAPAGSHPSFTADERVALELLSLQLTAAVESQRLRGLETARASLETELRTTRGQLAEQDQNLALLLTSQETEKAELAHELHEQAAQALVAIQLGLGAVKRDLGSEPSRGQLELLRTHLADTLRTVRELAVTLQPPALDQLGLEPALETLARRSGDQVTLRTQGLAGRLDPRIETTAYRLVDDILTMVRGPVTVNVTLDRDAGRLWIQTTHESPDRVHPQADELLARIQARVNMLGGSLTAQDRPPRTMLASIPVAYPEPEAVPA